MKLYEFAEGIQRLRKKSNNPKDEKFIVNNGIWMLAMQLETHYELEGQIISIGKNEVIYMDADPNARSPESQMIRAGIWDVSDCGWLVVSLRKESLLLAKVTPSERADLEDGYITRRGQLVIVPKWSLK